MLNIALGIILAYLLMAYLSMPAKLFGKDDTDGEKRSGLILLTDYGTGVQYVATLQGGLAVRVDARGKPVVVKGE